MKKAHFLFVLLLSQFSSLSQNIIIPDVNLKNALVNNLCVDNNNDSIGELDVDTNNDGEIQISEAEAVINLLLSGHSISSMEGIESFANIQKLVCSYNFLTNLNLTNLSKLKYLYCTNNQLKQLNIQNISSLKELTCNNNLLSDLNLNGLINLSYLTMSNNLFSTLDFSSLTTSLTYLDCSQNPLASININGLNLLKHLFISNTLLTTIDCSQSSVTQLFCFDNPNLTSINIKNNHYSYSDPDLLYFAFRFENLPLLSSICADLSEVRTIFESNYNENKTVVYSGEDCSVVIPFSPPMTTENFDFNHYYVFPNPVQNILTLEMNTLKKINTIAIYNMLGQLVKNISKPLLSKTISVSVSDLKTGTYIVEVDSDTEKVSKKLIKI